MLFSFIASDMKAKEWNDAGCGCISVGGDTALEEAFVVDGDGVTVVCNFVSFECWDDSKLIYEVRGWYCALYDPGRKTPSKRWNFKISLIRFTPSRLRSASVSGLLANNSSCLPSNSSSKEKEGEWKIEWFSNKINK